MTLTKSIFLREETHFPGKKLYIYTALLSILTQHARHDMKTLLCYHWKLCIDICDPQVAISLISTYNFIKMINYQARQRHYCSQNCREIRLFIVATVAIVWSISFVTYMKSEYSLWPESIHQFGSMSSSLDHRRLSIDEVFADPKTVNVKMVRIDWVCEVWSALKLLLVTYVSWISLIYNDECLPYLSLHFN